jgi:hypothetical protein
MMDVSFVALTNVETERAYPIFADFDVKTSREYNAPDPQRGLVRQSATLNHRFKLDAYPSGVGILSIVVVEDSIRRRPLS